MELTSGTHGNFISMTGRVPVALSELKNLMPAFSRDSIEKKYKSILKGADMKATHIKTLRLGLLPDSQAKLESSPFDKARELLKLRVKPSNAAVSGNVDVVSDPIVSDPVVINVSHEHAPSKDDSTALIDTRESVPGSADQLKDSPPLNLPDESESQRGSSGQWLQTENKWRKKPLNNLHR